MVRLARSAESRGFGAVWVADHFSGSVVGRSWSRDPFVSLGAIAAVTERINIGVLVANVMNRHPAQLAGSINSLQSLAPERVRLGVGSGAAPGSPFAAEHDAIGTHLLDNAGRRQRLIDSIGALHAIWNGDDAYAAAAVCAEVGFSGLVGVVDGARRPPIIVGASTWPTTEIALRFADGVNLRATAGLPALLERIGRERPDGFEVSVLDWLDESADDRIALERYRDAGVDRLILGMSPPHEPSRLDQVEATAW